MRGEIYRDKYADFRVIYYEDDPLNNCYCVFHKYYTFDLVSDKITFNNGIIETRDRIMIEKLNYWLSENTDLSSNNFYLYIKLKSINNEEFLNWWNDYNFKINIKSNKEQKIKELEIKEFEDILKDLHKKGVF